jgi:fibronectin-binding autotransporter adhesin
VASTSWNAGLNGNWIVGANWSAGVPSTGTDATINAFGDYTIALSGHGFASSLSVNAAGALLSETATGTLDIVNALTLETGKVALRGANTIGSINLFGGTLETGNNLALGAGALTMSGGELLGLANETFTNQMTLSGNLTFAAAHGTIMTQNASGWSFDATTPGAILFGQGANDGTIVWKTNSGSITNPGHVATEIVKGIFQAGDDTWGFLFQNASATQIDSAGTLDTAGFSGNVANLQGTGSLTNSSATVATVTVVSGGNFGGVISGAIALDENTGTLVLTGASTYSDGTTVESGATLQLGNGGIAGTIGGSITDNGTLVYDHSGALTITQAISGTGGVTYEGGTSVTVNRGEGYAGTTTVVDELATTNKANGFGNGSLTLQDSELVVTATGQMALTHVAFIGESTFSAGHGKTVTNVATNGSWALDGSATGATLNIGDSTNDGVVVWDTGAGSTVINISDDAVEIHAGTLRAGDSSFDFLTENVASVTVDAGATLDMDAFGGAIVGLGGAGSVLAHANANIEIIGGDFSGVIAGSASLLVEDGVVLTGANTYNKGTTIDTGSALSLGDGGTTGSVVGNIVDNGVLIFDRSDNISETATVSGTGQLVILGSGIVTINHAETYSGGTNVGTGELSINSGSAIGTGNLALGGGEFLTTATTSVDMQLSMSGNIVIAAATGTQANFNPSSGWQIDAINPMSIQFGDGTNDGTILFHTPAGSSLAGIGNYSVDVHSGVLKAGDATLGFLLDDGSGVTVDTGASINMAGFENDIFNLLGTGTIGNTGAATTITLEGGNFAGAITGAFTQVQLFDGVTLSSGGTFTGEFLLEASSTLNLSGHWAENLEFASNGEVFLHTPAQYTGHFVDFQAGDTINVRNLDASAAGFGETYNTTTGVLSLTDGTHSFSLTFDGAYGLGNFAATSDGHGGANITFATTMEAPPHLADIQGPILASEYPVVHELG